MIYGSICSGIEAATVAWRPLGWRPAFFSEVATFPRRVLAHHHPDTPLHGDFTTIEAETYEPIDILVGGTPCQTFSTSGVRSGLADDRGNLALEFLRIADRLRPRWLLWENVPGVLSNDRGRAFGSLLGGMAQLGYGFAYRVLDAQHVRVDGFERAVPQERRRVFVVGHPDWRRAAAVLLERERLGEHFGASSTKKSRAARDADADARPAAWAVNSHAATAAGHVTNHSHKRGGPVGMGLRPDVAYSLRAGRTQAVAHVGADGEPRLRRLTPVECERLQGLPDDYTNVADATDGERYRAVGNSMSVNCMRWIGWRIQSVHANR